jgi:hypothetical protein
MQQEKPCRLSLYYPLSPTRRHPHVLIKLMRLMEIISFISDTTGREPNLDAGLLALSFALSCHQAQHLLTRSRTQSRLDRTCPRAPALWQYNATACTLHWQALN